MAPNIFANLFGRSPVTPLQNHMQAAHECVKQLIPFIDAVLAGDWDKVNELQQEIARLENKADELKRELRMQLPSSLLLPVPRRDLLEVLTTQDKVANKAKDIAGLITGRKMTFPPQIANTLKQFVQRSIDASFQACNAINELDELVETGFSGREIKVVEAMIDKLDKIESDTDRIQVQIRSEIYALEKQLPPVDVIFMYKIVDWIGELADRAQRVGSRLELMLAR
ncbi:MAG: TIGR00153 family protein [Gammaproteobacteria bacterium]|jgi:predicted phosphate transport protein (TIGR00153 family)